VSSSGSGPGVIVLQEWWGLVPHVKNLCERFAAEGFTALAPDLYGGERTTDPDQAAKLMMALNIGETEKNLRGAVRFLLEQKETSSRTVGVVGYCMGGQLALFAASKNPEISGCADFYGIHPNVKPDLAALSGAVLGIFAEHDSYANAEAVAALAQDLTRLRKKHEFHTYPGTNHAFCNDDRPEVYDARAASDAWRRLTEFFRAEVG